MANENELLTVLHPEAGARHLTARKTAHLLNTQGFKLTGFVFRDEHGQVGICECSAVRWMTREQAWELMHPKQ